jgi:hypothetical protein
VPWEVVVLCLDGDRVNAELFEALGTTLDTGQAYDLLDLQRIKGTWARAERQNGREQNGN